MKMIPMKLFDVMKMIPVKWFDVNEKMIPMK